MNPAQRAREFGQSLWYDNISRDLLIDGRLASMITNWGVRGLTSNPTIFDKAVSSSSLYDELIKAAKAETNDVNEVISQVMQADIAQAADLLYPVYEQSQGEDGYVSIEVSPLLARDTQGTVEEGKRLFESLGRPNIMIKVPGTEEGLPAIRELLQSGINVNVTLLFSVRRYEEVVDTYIEALKWRVEHSLPIDRLRSVASFFVSRLDTVIDEKLTRLSDQASGLVGRCGILNSRLAYQSFLEKFGDKQFESLKKLGGNVQRPLWASTGTKNPAYRDTLYVEELIGVDTVNTVPHATLEAFVDHGMLRNAIEEDLELVRSFQGDLEKLGISLVQITSELEAQGVESFAKSFASLSKSVAAKMA